MVLVSLLCGRFLGKQRRRRRRREGNDEERAKTERLYMVKREKHEINHLIAVVD